MVVPSPGRSSCGAEGESRRNAAVEAQRKSLKLLCSNLGAAMMSGRKLYGTRISSLDKLFDAIDKDGAPPEPQGGSTHSLQVEARSTPKSSGRRCVGSDSGEFS